MAELNAERRKAAEKLRRLGPDLRTIREKLSTLDHEITQLDAARSQLDCLTKEAPAASPELEVERQSYERRQHILKTLRSVEVERKGLADRSRRCSGVSPPSRRVYSIIHSGYGKCLGDDTAPLMELAAAVEEVMTAAQKVDSVRLARLIDALDMRFEEASELYYQLRQQEQAVNESLKQQHVLKRQVDRLEQLKTHAGAARVEESRLLKERRNLRGELQRIDDKLYELRIAETDSINRDHGDTVQLTLGSSWNSRAYAERLSAFLTGSRIRSQEEVARSIADAIEPSALIDLTETGDAQRLAELLGRDLGQMTRVIAHLGDHPDLYELETELPAARLEVTLFDDGEPKPVETLSKGQRATALLPIILRPLPYPLLFDQPEDDLDNNFVFKSLIATLRQLKSKRQLIFVTHNANIPVLGGAEKIVVMSMVSPTKAAPALTGSVDSRKTGDSRPPRGRGRSVC